uniref:Uncharacterized protein n=1 Tax=Aegilops tauschii subsp. strangulata TaxID=200361 RepID=A0A453DHF3_AEGTS
FLPHPASSSATPPLPPPPRALRRPDPSPPAVLSPRLGSLQAGKPTPHPPLPSFSPPLLPFSLLL